MYRYLFFDLDGTLTDSKEGIIRCARYAIDKMGTPQPDEATLLKFIGPPLQDSFMTHCGYTRAQAAQALAIYRQRYVPVGQFENAPLEGAAGLLEHLHRRGYKLALASSKPEQMCIAICERFGFAPHLDVITGSPPQGDTTKADVIRETMARLGLGEADKPSILMIGDRKFDVLGAAECGIACLGVEFFGYAEEGELETAGAIGVVRTVEDLEQFILTH